MDQVFHFVFRPTTGAV